MFPDINNYNGKDPRQLIMYSWHFDLYAVREMIDNTQNNISKKIKESIKIAQDNLVNSKYDEEMIKVQEYHNIEPLAYQSYLLLIYSILEASLDRYCKICEHEMQLKIKLEDLNDKGLTRSVSYLEKVVETEIIKSNNIYRKINVINNLRNDFIHRAGYINSKDKINKYRAELGVEVIDGKIYLLYEDIVNIYNYIDEFLKFVFSRNFTNSTKELKIK